MADKSDAERALALAQVNGVNGTDGLNHVKHESDGEADDDLNNIDWGAQADQDDDDIKNLFAGDGMRMPEGFEQFGDKEIDQTGKADNAEDFEDIDLSDDDLDDDDAAAPRGENDPLHAPGLTEDEGTSHEERLDDLFGDDDGENDPFPSSPPREAAPAIVDNDVLNKPDVLADTEAQRQQEEAAALLNFPQYSADDNAIGDWITQTNNEDPSMQAPPQTEEELLQHKFPDFSQGKILYMNSLFPQWPAEYMYKEPPNKDRDPPEFVPTKLELELDADTSKLFRISDSTLAANQQRAQNQNDVEDWGHPLRAPALDFDDGLSDDSDGEQLVGGFTLDELATLCDDWETPLHSFGLSKGAAEKVAVATEDETMEDDWEREYLGGTETKVKKPKYKPGLPEITAYDASGIDDFVDTAKAGAKRVRIPRNDPYLLIEDVQLDRPTKRQKLDDKMVRMANGQLRRDVRLHFNISNDAAYDQLKINHKSKVRAVLSNRAVEHSMPALKLTFPFYRTGAPAKFWEHHRKKLEIEKVVKHAIGVRKPMRIKKKDWKNKSVAELFKTSKDLSLNDNSTTILFEYSEQHPIMLSNFGMGNRIINYYRAKDSQDTERPKAEIGEGHILMPEDRSPFSIFGTVDPGQTIPTLHNEMYRAPIFKHDPRPNDFLVGYSTNVAEGPKWYVRNIDHIYVVGQTFPSMEVPGPHARKVTNTSKNRLKMVCYRMMRKRETLDVSIGEVTPHVFDKVDPQNRQKLKEFLTYDRDRKTWSLREGETMMDGAGIRAMIKPEDVCVIESMQVGKKQLEGAGYDLKKDDDEDEGEKPLVAKLAPWEITKNFIEASAGKAMVALHGEGDPTGHGLGFSFIKTSMKGGYINAVQGPLATSADAIERERKANGGHSYNVKKQQDMYNAAIRQIWERQSATLSDTTTHADTDVLDTANEDDRLFGQQKQPSATPAAVLDDGRSQLSRLSGASRLSKRKLRIVRKKRNDAGELETESIIIEDAVVIRNYMKQRREKEEADRDVYSLLPTGDADENREKQRLVEKELSRLLKNQDRRQMRELQGKGKGKKKKADANGDASADPASIEKAAAGTTRKCANCGQVGHIKTNKRYWHLCTNPVHSPTLAELATASSASINIGSGRLHSKTVLWM
ncbi:uncharacterized protein B0I36DRAFT_247159 [Microdochium trichocladiopsis]|uniref:Transcription initiation factor TFIID subunit 1 histone acetyltransferase domain-containing protein n=1 Tax=Microdochium trichocladiopsis TaxID=1682393 RepID=A0A9P8Y202_9PEZI|nr:uncharacterized protein B0I36DRAFT_247159 [Microdochium trichocladiopsis]KAH7027423.1 hypothetical protein B0I36DRAFT_247159 [Microdochium trichocladiopsis]